MSPQTRRCTSNESPCQIAPTSANPISKTSAMRAVINCVFDGVSVVIHSPLISIMTVTGAKNYNGEFGMRGRFQQSGELGISVRRILYMKAIGNEPSALPLRALRLCGKNNACLIFIAETQRTQRKRRE